MVLIPRVPDVQNVLCKHDKDSGTAEAGAIVYLSGDLKVAKVSASGNVPFAMLGQRVKAPLAGLPQNFLFPGEIGASDAAIGDPVLLFHCGIFETNHYDLAAGVTAGDPLYAKLGEGQLTIATTGVALGEDATPKICAIAQGSLSAAEAAAGKKLVVKLAL